MVKYFCFIVFFNIMITNDKLDDEKALTLKEANYISSEYPKAVVAQLLNAIKLGSYEARQRFPRLLQIVELYPEISLQLFIEKVILK